MLSEFWTRSAKMMFLSLVAVLLTAVPLYAQVIRQAAESQESNASASLKWESSSRLRRVSFLYSDHGTLLIDRSGVEFRSANGHSRRWAFEQISGAFIAPHRLVLKTYVNRTLHLPGERQYSFEFTRALPPAVAAAFAEAIRRPSQNADPDPNAPAIAVIPVRHRTLTGGTNGVLRFRKEGIDYITRSKGDSRSWRWADLQSLSDPDPYQLFVFGYRDTYTFDLKAALSRSLIDCATDEIYAHNESIPMYAEGTPAVPSPQGTEMREK